jgi:hypothetical protein
MKKLIAMFLLLGLVSSASFAGEGEQTEVDCTKIFEGNVDSQDGDAGGEEGSKKNDKQS